MSKTLLVSVFAALLLIGISIIIYWQGIRPRYLPDSNEAMASEGAKAYSKLPMDKLTSPETIRESLAHTQIVLNGLATKRQAQAVLDQAADFLWYRFGRPSITEYEQWRRDSGYRLRPLSEIESAAFEYKNLLGKPIPDNQSVQKTFEEVVNISDQYEGGANHASGLAANENGLVLNFKKINNFDASPPWPYEVTTRPDGAIAGVEQWSGGVAVGTENWWRAPRTIEEIIASRKSTITATLAAVMEFQDGTRLPMMISFYLDPNDNKWRLYTIAITNYSKASGKIHGFDY